MSQRVNNLRVGFLCAYVQHTELAMIAYGAQERADELGLRLEIISVTSFGSYAAALRRVLRKDWDALILSTCELDLLPTALATAGVTKAIAGRQRIVAVDECLGIGERCVVQRDLFGGALAATRQLVQVLEHAGPVAHLRGRGRRTPTDGFHMAVAPFPSVDVVFDAEGEWTWEAGARLMRAALARSADVRGVLAHNDAMALGALAVVEETGRTETTLVASCSDASPDALRAVHDGRLLATVSYAPRRFGRTLIDIAARLARGESVPHRTVHEPALLTRQALSGRMMDDLSVIPGLLDNFVAAFTPELDGRNRAARTQHRLVQSLPPEPAQRTDPTRDIVWQAVSLMRQRVDGHVRVPDIARAVGVSPSYLWRLFVRALGQTPSEVLANLRVEQARTWLAEDSATVTQVASRLDYSTRQFVRIFTRHAGMTPREYVQRIRNRA